jgi:hypothetical protein
MNTEKLTLVNGNFWRNGQKVKPIIGDPEQIRLLKESIRRKELGVTDGTFTTEEVGWIANVTFQCSNCNHKNIAITVGEDEPFEYDPSASDLQGTSIECQQCYQEYEIMKRNNSQKWSEISLVPIED